MIEAALIAILTSATRSPLTSAMVGTRVYEGEQPEPGVFPSIVFHIVFDSSDYTHDGRSNLGRARVQVDCMALKQSDANRLARYVKAELGSTKQAVIDELSPPIKVQGIFHEGGSDDTASEMLNAGPRVGLRRVELQCHFDGA